MTQSIVNITGYKFTTFALQDLMGLQAALTSQALALGIKGTILLSTEGINVFVAGSRKDIDAYQAFLRQHAQLGDLSFKESLSTEPPFARLLVRIKKEIISMGSCAVTPEKSTAPYIEPEELQRWYQEGRSFTLLDTRNDYEVALGSFDDAIDIDIENFREFPDSLSILSKDLKDQPIVTFCTGGIRCEKAAALMQRNGFTQVYQLKGGILNYFEKVGGEHYHGDCFVFDKRLTVNSNLEPTHTNTCYEHRDQAEQQQTCHYCQHIQQSRQAEQHAP